MQKFFQRRSYPVPAILSTPAKSYPHLLSRNTFQTPKPSSVAAVSFSPPGVISHNALLPHELRMPAPTALHFVSCGSLTTDTFHRSIPPFLQRVSPTSNCGVCPCSIDVSARVVRPWVILKETQGGSRLAWLYTAAAGSGDGLAEGSEASEDAECAAKGAEEKGVISSEEKPLKFHRRRRSGNVGSGPDGTPDLLIIPGVGPRNLRKLVDKGIGKVGELKQLYKDKFLGKSNEKMVEYLQDSVGIIHKNHAESITTYIKESVDEELKEDDGGSGLRLPNKRITLCVEGNISVGKTTFLQRIANETFELQDLVEIVPEPIDKWQNIGPDHFNILDAFYAEPHRYAYTFQNYVFVTRVMQEKESSGGIKPLRLMERSVFTDRMVFVRAVHEAKWMNEMEISIYDSWFDPVVSSLPGLIPDGFIYLRASPDTCHKRMMLRNRSEEGAVSLDYLRDLHEKHESWLFPSESGSHGLLSVNKLPLSVDSSLHPDIRDRVIYLEGSHMHPSLQKVPALVLDCEANIDFNRDTEAKQHYARQIAEFFKFVKKSKELTSPETSDETAKKHSLLKPALWGPDGKQFLNLPINPMDLNRSMSFLSGG